MSFRYIINFSCLYFQQHLKHNYDNQKTIWISSLYRLSNYLQGLIQEYAKENVCPLEDLEIKLLFDPKQLNEGVSFRGLYLEGAFWAHQSNQIIELNKTTDFKSSIALPPFKIDILKKETVRENEFLCPLFVTPCRKSFLTSSGSNANMIGLFSIKCDDQFDVSHWIKRGVAMVSQPNKIYNLQGLPKLE